MTPSRQEHPPSALGPPGRYRAVCHQGGGLVDHNSVAILTDALEEYGQCGQRGIRIVQPLAGAATGHQSPYGHGKVNSCHPPSKAP
ncbi:MAG: hypothetical protein R2787_08215 [Saprospiraceae bacterium]